ncbi:hypothetical protein B0H15DRAFT_1023977 [Mycena belliarum]|uniref:F-box domain-containing protein n=1 Tax=Mycena belliarum TaxID=1033014 RepID=A0AAD6XK19_9AGAR|nr:hypothetical protein B0H15DRAFT_1023977 [Mycena belliae]
MDLATLSEELILLVCHELSIKDIVTLRQVCRVLSNVTRVKALWTIKLERAILNEGQILPPYLKPYDEIDVDALEALVRRMACLTKKCATPNLPPVKLWRLFLPQSITWLRLVGGTWLFAASSDNDSSKISCWDLSLVFQGFIEPLAEAYLPGKVKTGKLEIQDSGIVLALGLGPGSPAVLVITLRMCAGSPVFAELYRAEGSSHVLMLRGHLVGCAQRHGANIPHLLDWREQQTQEVPPPAVLIQIQSVPHLMSIWSKILVIVRTDSIELYSIAGQPIVFVKLLRTRKIWEAVVCGDHSVDAASPLRLVIITPLGIEMWFIERDILAAAKDPYNLQTCLLKKLPRFTRLEAPWYRLCVGQSGRRCFWLSAYEDDEDDEDDDFYPDGPDSPDSLGPKLLSMIVPLVPSDVELPYIDWGSDEDDAPLPALRLWALPSLDFDDALGLTVVGNCFGEIVICDHVTRHPELCSALCADFVERSPMLPVLPTANTYIPGIGYRTLSPGWVVTTGRLLLASR